MNIQILSEKKGSNPGGVIKTYVGQLPIDAYIKYCDNSTLPKNHPFTPSHQPIYEAITLKLAKKIGLAVPRFYLIDNRDQHVKFEYSNTTKHKLNDKKPFYLLSKLLKTEHYFDHPQLGPLLTTEKFYRDLFLIGDVSKRAQNRAVVLHPQPHIFYIDMGCSFVDSKENAIGQREQTKKLTRDRQGNEIKGLKNE